MADDDRSPSDLVELLAAVERAPYAFDVFQLLRRIEAICQDRPRFGMSSRPAEDAIRIGQEPSLTFAPAALAHFEPANGTAPARLETFFFGLFGPNGPLPLHLTEYARSRLRQNEDPASTIRKMLERPHQAARTRRRIHDKSVPGMARPSTFWASPGKRCPPGISATRPEMPRLQRPQPLGSDHGAG